MKKIILLNNQERYKVKYSLSKKKYFYYYVDRIFNNSKRLSFYKNYIRHRFCNLGPQYKEIEKCMYIENDKFHNLYGYAYIHKRNNIKQYYIYNEKYTKKQFNKYINLYNSIKYRRIY